MKSKIGALTKATQDLRDQWEKMVTSKKATGTPTQRECNVAYDAWSASFHKLLEAEGQGNVL
jgi:hypothetical protein